jgi:hypothetical protein
MRRDGNRTGFSDAHTVAGVTSTTSTAYCYDNTDRLTGTTVTNPQSGADPLASTSLTMAGTSPSLTYDQDGNTTILADQTLTYDSTDRHSKTTLSDGTVLDYVRDVSGRVVQRTSTPPSGSTTGRRPAQIPPRSTRRRTECARRTRRSTAPVCLEGGRTIRGVQDTRPRSAAPAGSEHMTRITDGLRAPSI